MTIVGHWPQTVDEKDTNEEMFLSVTFNHNSIPVKYDSILYMTVTESYPIKKYDGVVNLKRFENML